MNTLEVQKMLLCELPIDKLYKLAHCSIKKNIKQDWFFDFIYIDPKEYAYNFDTCSLEFIGDISYVAMFSRNLKHRQYAKMFIDNFKNYYKQKAAIYAK